MRTCLLLLALFAGGCFSPKYKSGDLHCEAGATPCPDGFHCAVDGTCWQNGHDPPRRPAHLTAAGGGGVSVQVPNSHRAGLSCGQPLTGSPSAAGNHTVQFGLLRSAVTK
jgi:hypothetical protein